MANRITGSTDTTGAISVRPKTEKSVLIVCANTSTATTGKANPEVITQVVSTIDANTKFGETVSKLTRVLINNGADNIKCIGIEEFGEGKTYASVEAAYEGALAKSLQDTSIKYIILDTTDVAVRVALKTHLGSAETEDFLRYGIVGSNSTTIEDAVTEAKGINDKRMFMPFPRLVDGSNVEQAGIYAAASLAARIMAETSDPALPMNGVDLIGFGGTNMTLLKSQRSTLEQAGITAIANDGTPSIWRLVTTSTDPVWHEGSTLFIADDVLETVRTTLQATFKRTKNTARILDAIRTTVIGILEAKEGLEIIENFDKSTVSVIKDPEDIYGALVDYEFDVVTPLYTITITQHMKL